ncbi:PKD domain-containing protein [Carboxylicivirga caseinilyticus]|uniref:PKD domain-containing protein n=1 Tax=Carboxylicivirga caseinilyticus TaxID=3417572 RepID=UPI003D357899|nr:PKD domain-containing protein [Marinilabiliaceae bacterium A049]
MDGKKRALLILFYLLFLFVTGKGQDCNIISKANDIIPDKLCAPVTVDWTVTYRGVNNAGTSVEFIFRWDDGNPAEIIPAINTSGNEWTLTYSHVYPIAGDKCNYEPNVSLVVNGVECTSSIQTQNVTVWDTDEYNGGEMAIDPLVFPICVGNDGTVTFVDNSQWNCTPPDENDFINERKRWIQWIYGTGGTNINTALVNGVLETYPMTGTVDVTTEPIYGPVPPLNTALPIYIPNNYNVGDYFEITLRNWNQCNPYDDPNIPGTPADPINGDHPPVITTAIALIVDIPDGTVNSAGPFCENEDPVTLTAVTSGGVWSGPGIVDSNTGIFDPSIAGSGTHTIDYYVEDGNGCSATGQTVIEVIAAPSASITTGSPVYLCPGTQLDLDGNPSGGALPYTHLWKGDITPLNNINVQTPQFITSDEGNYELIYRVTDDNSCYDEDTILVVVDSVAIIFANDYIELCTGSSKAIEPNPVGGSGVYVQHTWSGDRTDLLSATDVENPVFNATEAGTFKFEYYVLDSHGCEDSDSITVVVYETPIANAGPDSKSCGLRYYFEAVPTKGSGTWSLVTGPGNASVSDLGDPNSLVIVDNYGDYTFQWTEDNNGCTDVDEVLVSFVQIPNPQVMNDADTCGLDMLLVAIPDIGAGSWKQVSGPGSSTFNNNLNANTDVSVDLAGKYKFAWVEINDVCEAGDTVTIDFYPVVTAAVGPFDDAGCSPYSNQFVNQSLNADSYLWDFGDGFGSNQVNPSHTFSNPLQVPADYTLKLLAYSNYGCRDSVEYTITVNPNTISKFTNDPAPGCSPLLVDFTNESVGATEYEWTFGDGSPASIEEDVSHSFINSETFVKSYEVKLAVNNTYDCPDTSSAYITVYPLVGYDFAAEPVEGCHPLKVDFLGDPGAYSYNWDFGDGTIVSGINAISHIFENTTSASKSFNVNLYTSSVFGCLDTAQAVITVNPSPVSMFSYTPTEGCAPLLVDFTNESQGAGTSHWFFGDGQSTDLAAAGSVSHTYLNEELDLKSFTAKLLVENSFGCKDSSTSIVKAFPAVQAAISDGGVGCSPFVETILNESAGAVSFSWDFGDGNTINSYNGINEFINTGTEPSVFNVAMEATSSYGCKDTAYTTVTVNPSPVSSFQTTPSSGCAPLNVQLTNSSIGAEYSKWYFGDGTLQEVTGSSDIVHVYDNDEYAMANYTTRLVVGNSYACKDSSETIVQVFPKVLASISDGEQGCSPYEESFINNSEGANKFYWDFGDGNSSTSYTGKNIFLNSTLNDQVFDVSMIAESSFGCKDTAYTNVTVYKTPDASFNANPKSQQMPNSTVSIENTTAHSGWNYTWWWGNGDSYEGQNPVSYTYGESGDFDIKLVVKSEHCSDSTYEAIEILPMLPSIDYGPDTLGCPPLTVKFYNNSVDAHTFLWDFGDGNISTEKEPTHTYYTTGDYKVTLTAEGSGGVIEADDVTVTVFEVPVADFEVRPIKVKLPQTVSFINKSEGAVAYLWDFGDGNTSTEHSIQYLYQEPGTYDVTLLVENDKGCTNERIIRSAVVAEAAGEIDFPNAFTPNPNGPNGGQYTAGDPDNFVFYPFVQDGVVEYNLKIFTRWGELIYESEDVKIGWDGYYRGKLCAAGVYIWKVVCKYSNGTIETRTGDVTLFR